MKIFVWILCLLPIITFAEFKVAIDENYVKNSNVNLINDLKEAYRRIGIDAVMEVIPGERAVQKTISGDYQALDYRILNPEVFTGLVPVQEPIYMVHNFNAYSLKQLKPINSYQDLAQYVIAFPRGIQLQKKIKSIVPELKTFTSPTIELLIPALEKNRADIMIFSGNALGAFFTQESISQLIQLNEQPLEIMRTYHHLHHSQAHLAPKLEQVFIEMKNEGYFKMGSKE